MNGKNYRQMSEVVRNEKREHDQNAPILVDSSQSNEENGQEMINHQISGQHRV